MLLLTGLRLKEAAQISWPELQGNIITIPASRMKGREGKAREHLVPLSSAAQEIIASLPRIKNGSYLFSQSAGKRPQTMTGKPEGSCSNMGFWNGRRLRLPVPRVNDAQRREPPSRLGCRDGDRAAFNHIEFSLHSR
jgi:integrase